MEPKPSSLEERVTDWDDESIQVISPGDPSQPTLGEILDKKGDSPDEDKLSNPETV